jgi:hypothetical protein
MTDKQTSDFEHPMFEMMTRQEPIHPDLAPYLREGRMGRMIHHPLVVDFMIDVDRCAVINTRYLYKKQAIDDALDDADWGRYVGLHERPYRLEALIDCLDEGLTDAEPKVIGEVLSYVWTDSENIYENFFEWETILQDKALAGGWLATMDESERKVFDNLPDVVTVYRGTNCEEGVKGFSWTLDRAKAKWFAKRFANKDNDCLIVHGTVAKTDVVAYFDNRNEKEIVALADNVVITKIEKVGP